MITTIPLVAWSKLPQQLRQAHVFETVITIRNKNAPSGENYNDHEATALREIGAAINKILSPVHSSGGYEVAVDPFMDTNSNPKSENVASMLKRVGCIHIFKEQMFIDDVKAYHPSLNSDVAIRLQLDTIIQNRHAVAHGRRLTGLVRSDLKENMHVLLTISKAIQRLLEVQCNRLLSS